MIEASQIAPERHRPLRRAEYDRLVELGAFADERLELLEGTLVEMSLQGARHSEVVKRLTRLLVLGLVDRADILIQLPFAAGDHSEPEPDVLIVPRGDYSAGHPTQAFWVIEVAESSVRKDRLIKAEIYARAQVQEYWLVDLAQNQIEVRTKPEAGTYRALQTFGPGDVIVSQAFPDVKISGADLLP